MGSFVFLLLILFLLFVTVSITGHFRRARSILWFAGVVVVIWIVHRWPVNGPVILFRHIVIYMDKQTTIGRLVFHVDTAARMGMHLALVNALVGSIIILALPTLDETIPWWGIGLITTFLAVSVTSPWAWGWGVAIWAIGVLAVAYGGWPTLSRRAWTWLLLPLLSTLLLFMLLAEETLAITHVASWRVHLIALFLLGFSSLAPFHIGSVCLAEEGQPFGMMWGLWTHTVVFLVILSRVEGVPAYREALWTSAPFLKVMAYMTLIWAGLGGLSQQHVGRLTGYALIFNWALTLLLWLMYPNNLDVIRWTMAVRLIGIVSVSIGLISLLSGTQSAALSSIKGWARRRTWGVLLWTLGIATLAGLPFTAGGWLLWIMPPMKVHDASLWLMLLGSVGLLVGLGRALTVLWGPLETPLLPREEGVARWALWLLSMALIVSGLIPSFVLHLGKWLVG